MSKKITSIELLRFLSALAVVLYHYNTVFNHQNTSLTGMLPLDLLFSNFYKYGYYGVEVFFIISGFVFSHMYLVVKKKISAKAFFIKRFARLYPLHFATLIIFLFFVFLDFNFYQEYFDKNQVYIDLYHFTLQLFFISHWGFEEGFSYNVPSWSISLEIGIYIFFFLIIDYLKKFRVKLSVVIVILCFIFYKLENVNFIFDEYILLFFMGVIIYQIPKIISLTPLRITAFFCLIISFVGNFKALLFCPSLMILVLSFENYVQKKSIKNYFLKLGSISYSLYLLHYPLMLIFLLFEKKNFINYDFYYSPYFFIFFIFILLFISSISFYFFEKPLNKKIRSIFL